MVNLTKEILTRIRRFIDEVSPIVRFVKNVVVLIRIILSFNAF